MSLSIIHSGAVLGVRPLPVIVETHLSNGLPSFSIVGLPEAAVRESKERVRSALINSGFDFPMGRITVNLAPADMPKAGGRYDLAIALGILAASGQLSGAQLESYEFYGELALSGDLREVPGLLPMALQSPSENKRCLVVPLASAAQLACVKALNARYATSLVTVVDFLKGQGDLDPPPGNLFDEAQSLGGLPDFSELKGQIAARRALEVAVSGGHNILMEGPPGVGKTFMVSCLPGIVPVLDDGEALEVAAVHSLSDRPRGPEEWYMPPLRSPHHSLSVPALLGGTAQLKPGEISLAHGGILFLDELPEFDRRVLESLREPLESGKIYLSRAQRKVAYPARFMLVAAMNPCPCGYWGQQTPACRCTPHQRQRYRGKLSGPLLDRIDLHIKLQADMPVNRAAINVQPDSSATILGRVGRARKIQRSRCGKLNAELEGVALDTFCGLAPESEKQLDQAVTRLNLSLRARNRVLRVARTLADLDESQPVELHHVLEALAYRLPPERG